MEYVFYLVLITVVWQTFAQCPWGSSVISWGLLRWLLSPGATRLASSHVLPGVCSPNAFFNICGVSAFPIGIIRTGRYFPQLHRPSKWYWLWHRRRRWQHSGWV